MKNSHQVKVKANLMEANTYLSHVRVSDASDDGLVIFVDTQSYSTKL